MKIVEIDEGEVLLELNRNRTRNLHEIEELQQGKEMRFFRGEDDLCCVSQVNSDRLFCMFICSESFKKDFLEQIMKRIFAPEIRTVTISINAKHMDTNEMCKLGYVFKGNYKSFVFKSEVKKALDKHIFELKEEHIDIVEKCQFPVEKGRPGFKTLFEVFVVGKEGRILCYREGDRIVGYLSFLPSTEGIMDVDYIYVDNEYRKKGIGKAMSEYYADIVTADGMIPYWGNAICKASEKTAEAAGFECCSEHFYFNR